ncbi:MAG: asparagine synthase (glutamine-hydrolyzing) [Candidatus Omnitrophica bacterium]|nr:asparagine synthase (glutamine-hydrolyzing) [Candidatus Omnitrophota bacterium]
MCGICGKFEFNSDRQVSQSVIIKMADTLKHRPSKRDVFIDDNIGLGLITNCCGSKKETRCSGCVCTGIQNTADLEKAKGLTSKEKDLLLVYEGELYNFNELRQDLEQKGHILKTAHRAEVIIHLYEEYGADCIKYLNGIFALAIWDKRAKALLLARDRFGNKPLFYTIQSGGISFGSEIKAILADPNFNKHLDYSGLHDFFSYNYVPDPKTLVKDVNTLPPGHLLLCSGKKVSLREYWKPSEVKQEAKSDSYYFDSFYEKLKESAVRQLDQEKSIGLLFSGGVDSSSLAYLTDSFGKVKPRAFYAAFRVKKYNTAKTVLDASDSLNIDATRVDVGPEACKLLPKIIWHRDSLAANPAILGTYLVSDYIKNNTDLEVAFSGSGSDETLGGFNTYLADIANFHYSRLVPKGLKRGIATIADKFSISNWPVSLSFKIRHLMTGTRYNDVARAHYFWRLSFSEQEKQKLYSNDLRGVASHDSFDAYKKQLSGIKGISDFNKIIAADFNILSPNFLQPMFDCASRATGLKIRSPFLDNSLIDFIMAMPFNLKVRRLESKYCLKKAMKGKLPAKIIFNAKKGLSVPVGPWMKKEAKPMVTDYLSEANLKKMGYFNVEYVQSLLKRHFSGAGNNTFKIWALLNFAIWHNLFFE